MAEAVVETAPCFCCGGTRATPAGRWWLLPALADHVRCLDCGRTFDAATGASNAVVLIVYALCGLAATGVALAAWAAAPIPPGGP